MNGTDSSTIAAYIVAGYSSIIALFAYGAIITGRKLHDFALECALEQERQDEALGRLFMAAYPESAEDA